MDKQRMEEKMNDMDILAQNVNNLSHEEKVKFVVRLKQEIKHLKAKIIVKEAIKNKIKHTPKTRDMSQNMADGTSAGYALASGVLGGMISAEMTDNILFIIGAMGVGCVTGLILAILNGIAYETKPISNKINDFRMGIVDQQSERLRERLELRQYLDEKMKEEMGE